MKQKIQIILAYILGIVVSSGVVYAVTLYQAKEVAYDNSNSGTDKTEVQSALDELYEMAETHCPDGYICEKLIPAITTITELVNTNPDELYIDNHNDIRYYGRNVNNYVTFNDELWRILGIIDGKVKIMRSSGLPVVLSDNGVTLATEICFYGCSNYFQWNTRGNNNWNNSTLNGYLNGSYYNNFKSNYKDMISNEIYYLGGPTTANYSTLTGSQYYDIERSNQVYSGNPTTVNQNIGLLYASDIIYSGGEKYIDMAVTSINSSMTFIENGFTLTPLSDVQNEIMTFHSDGVYSYFSKENVNSESTYWRRDGEPGVVPVLYLKDNVRIIGGDGSKSNPYLLSF